MTDWALKASVATTSVGVVANTLTDTDKHGGSGTTATHISRRMTVVTNGLTMMIRQRTITAGDLNVIQVIYSNNNNNNRFTALCPGLPG